LEISVVSVLQFINIKHVNVKLIKIVLLKINFGVIFYFKMLKLSNVFCGKYKLIKLNPNNIIFSIKKLEFINKNHKIIIIINYK